MRELGDEAPKANPRWKMAEGGCRKLIILRIFYFIVFIALYVLSTLLIYVWFGPRLTIALLFIQLVLQTWWASGRWEVKEDKT
ncbi:MAG: hypothetical protein DRO00_06165 [Thermoproteota archaeon]|nr:MAG: hypothetical protein DRO00_06165 [Candidatus Korarchaeota archaeon]